MSGSINNVTLVGRLTKDPELRKTASGKSVCTFNIACDRPSKGGDDQQQMTADFPSCVAWNKTAETIVNYCEKGSQIGIIGSLQTGHYDKADGTRVYTTDVIVNRLILLGSKQQKSSGYDYPRVGTSIKSEDIDKAIASDPNDPFNQNVPQQTERRSSVYVQQSADQMGWNRSNDTEDPGPGDDDLPF